MRFRLRVREIDANQWNHLTPNDLVSLSKMKAFFLFDDEDRKEVLAESMDEMFKDIKILFNSDGSGKLIVEEGISGEEPKLTVPEMTLTATFIDGRHVLPDSKIYRWVGNFFAQEQTYMINTVHGNKKICPGDWIIRDADGKIAVMKDGEFRAAFEPITQ